MTSAASCHSIPFDQYRVIVIYPDGKAYLYDPATKRHEPYHTDRSKLITQAFELIRQRAVAKAKELGEAK